MAGRFVYIFTTRAFERPNNDNDKKAGFNSWHPERVRIRTRCRRQRRRRRRRRHQRQRRLRHLESVFKYIFAVSMWVQLQLSDVILGPEARGLDSAEIYC